MPPGIDGRERPSASPPARPSILVTGASGQVGHELVRALAPLGRVIAPPRSSLDLYDLDALRSGVATLRPDVIVNAAAYTAVDQAEGEPGRCHRLNAEAPAVLAESAAAIGAVLVHYSTDYVFDGASPRPYVETDTPNPLNVYGATKLAGEAAIAASGATHFVLRTSWVYGARGSNFLRTIIRMAREREELRVVADQVGAPTWSRAIAESTAVLLGALSEREGRERLHAASGTYHLASAGETSWHGFATAIVAALPEVPGRERMRVVPIPSSGYPTPARRPARSLLDSGLIRERFGIAIPDWRLPLDLVLRELRTLGEL